MVKDRIVRKSNSFVEFQFLFDLLRQPMTNQRLIGDGLRCSNFSDRLNLEGIHFDGHILELSFPLS